MGMIRCTKCGTELPEGSKFCLECGNKLIPQDEENFKTPPTGLVHYAYGNNQSCAGRSNIVVRNGFVYYINKGSNEVKINVSPLNDNSMIQTLYYSSGDGCTAACLNMVNDELIFYEYASVHRLTAINVYTGERRTILENHRADSIWIENNIISFVEDGQLKSVFLDATGYYEYKLGYNISDRLIGYNGKLYAVSFEDLEIIEIPYLKPEEAQNIGFKAENDIIYAVIGNLYYSSITDSDEKIIICQNIESSEIINGIQEIDRMITAFEQYVIFSRKGEPDYSFAWNIQTLRVYKLNRMLLLKPYSFTQVLSDYIMIDNDNKLYKIPAHIFFQGNEPLFTDNKFLFAEI